MRTICALLAGALLAGCATFPGGGRPQTWAEHYRAVSALDEWAFSGRIALSGPEGQVSARLRWEQRRGVLRLEVSGPAGIGQRVLERADGQLRLWQDGQWQPLGRAGNTGGRGGSVGAADWGQSLGLGAGVDLPLDHLPWWLRGLPEPDDLPATTRLDGVKLAHLQQAGWTVEYQQYQRVAGLELPARIAFSGGAVEGKLLLKRWTLGP